MLEAERDALKWEAYHGSLNILEREMLVITNYMNNVGTAAALLIGFSLTALTEEMPTAEFSDFEEGLLCLLAVISMGLMLYTVVLTTLVASLGPEHGLTGRDGTAMRSAVENMKKDRQRAQISLGLGLTFFMLTASVRLWMKTTRKVNFAISIVALASLYAYTLASASSILKRYHTPPNSTTMVPNGQNVVSGAEFVARVDGAASVGGGTLLGSTTPRPSNGRISMRRDSKSTPATCSTPKSVTAAP
jgi:hypothetical protein